MAVVYVTYPAHILNLLTAQLPNSDVGGLFDLVVGQAPAP